MPTRTFLHLPRDPSGSPPTPLSLPARLSTRTLRIACVAPPPLTPSYPLPSTIPQRSGKRWKFIAEQLGNANPRTAAMVRNRYLRIERGRQLTQEGKSKNRCGQCGELKRGHVCQKSRSGSTSFEMAFARAHPGSPPSPAQSVTTKLNLGAAAPLTMVTANDDAMSMGSPDLLALGTLGRSPMASLGGGTNPPHMRPQSSFDMLLKASEIHTSNNAGGPPTLTRPGLHQSSTMKILADTPNSTNGDFPFGGGGGSGGAGGAGGGGGTSQTPFSSMKGDRALDGLPSPTALAATSMACAPCELTTEQLRERSIAVKTEELRRQDTLSEELSEEAA